MYYINYLGLITRGINSSLMKPPEYKLEFFEFKLSLLSLLGLY